MRSFRCQKDKLYNLSFNNKYETFFLLKMWNILVFINWNGRRMAPKHRSNSGNLPKWSFDAVAGRHIYHNLLIQNSQFQSSILNCALERQQSCGAYTIDTVLICISLKSRFQIFFRTFFTPLRLPNSWKLFLANIFWIINDYFWRNKNRTKNSEN